MTRLSWSEPGSRTYQAGVDRGVLYAKGAVGIPWDGLISVTDTSEGFEDTGLYIDGVRQRTKTTSESYSATVEAFTYPDGILDHSDIAKNQNPPVFDFSFRTNLSADLDVASGYQIHLVYNATARLSPVDNSSMGNEVEPEVFTWTLSTMPVEIVDYAPSAHVILSSLVAYPMVMSLLEDMIYGSDETFPRMPSIQEVMDVVEGQSILFIIDHGDGTWTASGPDEAIRMLDATTFEINWPSAKFIDNTTYKIRSL